MGRSFDTGFLRNVVSYDASGNVGLGGAVDATYKLKVTGAMQVTGAALITGGAIISGSSSDCYVDSNNANTLNFGYNNNAAFDGWINYKGYLGGSTQFRNTIIGNGKLSAIATFVGSTGNVGIGNTGNASYKLLVSGNNASVDSNGQNTIFLSAGTSVSYIDTSYIGGGSYVPMAFGTGGSERMRITSAGNVGIGTSNPGIYDADDRILQIYNAASSGAMRSMIRFTNTNSGTTWGNGTFLGINDALDLYMVNEESANIRFGTAGTERMRITSTGNLSIGNTDNGARLTVTAATGAAAMRINADSGQNAISVSGTGNINVDYPGVGGGRFQIDGNGNTYNRTGVYGTVSSDRRLKENIVPATSKLNDLLKLSVVNFNLIGSQEKQIGFIAQEMQEVFPSFVYEKDTREYDEDGNLINGLKDALGVKVGMEFAILVKAIQEQNEIITKQGQAIDELKALIAAK